MFDKVAADKWNTAHSLLDGKPEGRKLPPKGEKHSFVVLGEKIIAVNSKAVIGIGARAKVVIGFDENQKPVAVKKEKDGAIPKELEILKDRNLLIGSHKINYDSDVGDTKLLKKDSIHCS